MERIQREPEITRRFYLTGGTALSEFYLRHRKSFDIDLFTEKEEVDQRLTDAFLRKISPELNILHIKRSQFMGLFSYVLIFEDKEELKVDFSYYPFPQIQKGAMYKNLKVDSIYDIATNKLQTIFTKPRSRDYLDLYFIMQKYDYSLPRLILDTKAKFDWNIDRITLASQFLKVQESNESSMVLVPFDKNEMDSFYIKLAKSLEKEIFK